MSEYTITLSGPKVSENQARNALAAEQFDVLSGGHDYGLPPHTEEQAETFINVHGSDVDRAWDAVRSLGWRLRLHHEKIPAAPPSIEEQLAAKFNRYENELVQLKAKVAQLEGSPPPMAGGAVESPPWAEQNTTIGAEQFRRGAGSLLQRGGSIGSITGGIVGSGDCTITPPGSGMTTNTAPGEVWVPGSSAATQSGYYCRVSSSTSLAIAASDPSNPRVDREAAVVTDSAYAGGTNTFALAIVTGTPTAGATLVNLNGVGAAPASSYTLGYVLVPATATNIVGGDISNVATVARLGLTPQYPGWQTITLGTSIGVGAGYTPSARLEGDVVRLKGTMINNTGTSQSGYAWATVPSGLRPSGTLRIDTYPAGLQIGSNGIIFAEGTIANLGEVGLDSVTFTLS